MKKINKAFTLVELIVVITILAVLWSIAFVSFQWYTSNSRDSVRVTDLKNIWKVLSLRVVEGNPLFYPEKSLEINGDWEVIQYQWTLSQWLLDKYWINNWWVDPLDGENYWYVVNKNQNKYQLLSYLENWDTSNSFSSTFFGSAYANAEKPFIKLFGDELWFLLNPVDKKVLNSVDVPVVDILTTNDNYLLAIDNKTELWNKNVLKKVVWNQLKSCKSILDTFPTAETWIYTISQVWEVQCDMTTDWGGWTLVMRVDWKTDYLNSNKVWELRSFVQDWTAKKSDYIINSIRSTDEFLIKQWLNNENIFVMKNKWTDTNWNSTLKHPEMNYRCVWWNTFFATTSGFDSNKNFLSKGNCWLVWPLDNAWNVMSYGNFNIYMYADVRERWSCWLWHCNILNQNNYVPGSIWVR